MSLKGHIIVDGKKYLQVRVETLTCRGCSFIDYNRACARAKDLNCNDPWAETIWVYKEVTE